MERRSALTSHLSLLNQNELCTRDSDRILRWRAYVVPVINVVLEQRLAWLAAAHAGVEIRREELDVHLRSTIRSCFQ